MYRKTFTVEYYLTNIMSKLTIQITRPIKVWGKHVQITLNYKRVGAYL